MPARAYGRIAVIDIGSNSIKMLVAERNPSGRLAVIEESTDETRIGSGISRTRPRLLESSMTAGIASVGRLRKAALKAGAGEIRVTATSAVRDAVNRDEFASRLRAETGLELQILTGLEEAETIARGVRTDPDLQDLTEFHLFDLGGGSLEALSIQGDRIRIMTSLPLGCVRLTEQFIPDREAPFSAADREKVDSHVRDVIRKSIFAFATDGPAATVITGGTAAIARSLSAAAPGGGESPTALLTRQGLEQLLSVVAPLTLAERKKHPGLPPDRADVFPVALSTLLAVLDEGGIASFNHSFHNLRYGMAHALL